MEGTASGPSSAGIMPDEGARGSVRGLQARRIARSVGRVLVVAAAGLGITTLVLIAGLVALAGQPHWPMLLALAVIALAIVAAYRLARLFGLGLSAIVAVAIVAVFVSQLVAATPPIVDAAGQRIPGSIAEMRTVGLGGADQWIVMRGRSTANPVLLVLNGGPGGTQLAWHRQYLTALEDRFTVVYWEQRGSGRSAGLALADYAGLTPQRYVSDGLELTAWLRERFGQDRIYLAGQSWGTMLGVWMVQQRPEWFRAYVGIGQMTNPVADDRMIYDFVMEKARQEGDTAFIRSLDMNGPPPYHGFLESMKYTLIFGRARTYETALVERSNPPDLPPLVGMTESPEYGLADQVGALAGAAVTFARVYDQLDDVDLERDATRLAVPVFLAEGRYDLNAMTVLAERWFDKLQAPTKQLVWFEHSGHNPEHEEPAAFVEFMVNTVLAHTSDEAVRRFGSCCP